MNKQDLKHGALFIPKKGTSINWTYRVDATDGYELKFMQGKQYGQNDFIQLGIISACNNRGTTFTMYNMNSRGIPVFLDWALFNLVKAKNVK